MCLFAPAPYYKLNKGFFLGFLFKPLGGLRPPRGLNKKASEKHPLSITYWPFCKEMSNLILRMYKCLGLQKPIILALTLNETIFFLLYDNLIISVLSLNA